MTLLLVLSMAVCWWLGAPLVALALAGVDVTVRYHQGEPIWTR